MTEDQHRAALSEAQRVVVKVGTHLIVQRDGRINHRRVAALAGQISELMAHGREIVLVSSGAIGAALRSLGMTRRPGGMAALQMAAAVGQPALMSCYTERFRESGHRIGQVLLTHGDLRKRESHLNVRATLLELLRNAIVPIVNENDAVAVDEIRFGDNDNLAALVSILIHADALVLLTTVDGLQEAHGSGTGSRRVRFLPEVTSEHFDLVWSDSGRLSVGGMESKLTSARIAANGGARTVIADGRSRSVLTEILEGADVGTLVAPSPKDKRLSRRKGWIAFFRHPEGSLIVDEGAARALTDRGGSLLPVGVRDVHGNFEAGALVSIQDGVGTVIGRGLVDYSSSQIERIRGLGSEGVAELLGDPPSETVVHRDNLVVFRD